MVTENAQKLLEKRYFQEGEKTWSDIAHRVAEGVSQAEDEKVRDKYYKKFYDMINDMYFIPSTPCLLNANKEGTGQLSSCFIISLRDNIESIYHAKGECAKIFQKNGGVGFNISVLRPIGSAVETSKGYSCGTIGFMEEFDLTADVVTRNNVRKGAIKIDLNDWHPDIYKFIHCKDDITKFKRMNISVLISDKFMKAVENDEDWALKFPDYHWNKEIYNREWDGDIDEWERKGYPVKIYEIVKARDLYNEIMESAWRTGEPGVSFKDAMERDNPNPSLGKTNSTNPCSEFVSIPYNSCNLGSINLTKFVVDGTKYDFNKLQDYIRLAVRFIDDMITVNKLPLRKIEEVTKSVRSVGLGVMGLADTLYMIKIPYNSEQAKKFIEFLFYIIQQTAIDTSMELAQEKGVYKHYKNSVWYKMGIPMRNSNLLSIAPTGSISFIANVSQSIEPNYALTYRRKTNEGDEYIIVNEIFKNELIKRGIYSDDLINKIIENNGSCQGIDEIPKDIQEVFLTTYDLTPKEHVDVVKIIQKYVDLSISKTINLKQDTTLDDMKEIYLYAWKAGLKGITVYRDGSRDNVLSTKTNSKEKIKEKVEEELKRGYIKPAPKESLNCKTVRIDTGCGTMYLTMTKDEEGNINQTFISRGSKGTCVANQTAVSRLLSIGLRGGIPLEVLIDQLLSIPICASYHGRRKEGLPVSKGSSCPSAVAYELLKFANESKEKVTENKVISNKNYEFTVKEIQENKPKNICPECGNELQYEGGCVSCVACGFSKCN